MIRYKGASGAEVEMKNHSLSIHAFKGSASMKYEYDVGKLWTGASYGNLEAYARTSAESNLYGLWSSLDDQHYCGKWRIVFYVEGERLEAQRTVFAPAHQTTSYQGQGVSALKTFFLPYGDGFQRAVYFILEGQNQSGEKKQIGIVCDIEYPEFVWPEYVKTADLGQKRKRVKSELVDGKVMGRTEGRENEVRIVGSSAELQAYFFSSRGASLTYSMELDPGETKEEALVMVIGSSDEPSLLKEFDRALDYRSAFARTYEGIERVLNTSDFLTPDPAINRAVRWAKINTIREQKRYPAGMGFTNDPPQDVLVVRDAAWFSFGSDYITPGFSEGMLDLIRRHGVEEGGKITEYILACDNPPFKYDYGLNINDNSPLFMIAAYHHYALSRNTDFLRRIYPTVRNAALWILAQREDGLVQCKSEESNAWGICGWRNIIPGYQQNGAVTEINSECCLALKAAACMAEQYGDNESQIRFDTAADQLKEAINARLAVKDSGFYLLNIAQDGSRNDALSGDMIFPVITGVADDATTRRVLDRLAESDFWTDYGIRTVPRGHPGYDPEFAARLMGGIWPNLTAWVAYANRKQHPERMVEAMHNLFRISEVPVPRDFRHVVPGQFPECLHGETFLSRGMALSPWVAPTFLWVAFEGILGIEPTTGNRPHTSPNLPATWKWAAVRSMPLHGRSVSLFLHEGIIYSNVEWDSECPQEVFDRDITDQVRCNAYTIALERPGETVIFVAADQSQEIRVEVEPRLHGEPSAFDFMLGAGEARVIRARR